MAKTKFSAFDADLLDELLKGQHRSRVLSSPGLLGDLKKALVGRVLNAEMDTHLDREARQQDGNHRNGTTQKTVLSPDGDVVPLIPRDRHGHFDPALVK